MMEYQVISNYHLSSKIEDWIMKHVGDTKDVALYVQSISNMLLQPKIKLVDKKIKRCKNGFSKTTGQDMKKKKIYFDNKLINSDRNLLLKVKKKI